MLKNHGIRIRIIQNCGHFYITENLVGRDRIVLYMPDLRSFLACGDDIGMNEDIILFSIICFLTNYRTR